MPSRMAIGSILMGTRHFYFRKGRNGGLSVGVGFVPGSVRRQNIWRNSRRRLAERRPRLGVDVRQRACGVASGDVRWSVA